MIDDLKCVILYQGNATHIKLQNLHECISITFATNQSLLDFIKWHKKLIIKINNHINEFVAYTNWFKAAVSAMIIYFKRLRTMFYYAYKCMLVLVQSNLKLQLYMYQPSLTLIQLYKMYIVLE